MDTLDELGQIEDSLESDDMQISVLEDIDELIDSSPHEVQSSELTTPCILIENLKYEVELKYLATRKVDITKSLPLFVSIDSVCKKVGHFEMTLDAILELKLIGIKEFYLCKSETEKVVINTEDAKELEKFITL